MTVEVCTDSIAGALIAEHNGASRVEFCAALPQGGITPSYGAINTITRPVNDIRVKIPVNVLIRPREGDFLYTSEEYTIMMSDIIHCGRSKCNGVVIGGLRKDGSVDTYHCGILVRIAHEFGMKVTFHRAFDRSRDLFEAMEDIIELGCDRILTSGGYASAIEGKEVIRQLIEKAGSRIIIMPGAGITPDNAQDLIQYTGAKEIHGTFSSVYPSGMTYINDNFDANEYISKVADGEKIKKVVES